MGLRQGLFNVHFALTAKVFRLRAQDSCTFASMSVYRSTVPSAFAGTTVGVGVFSDLHPDGNRDPASITTVLS